MERWRHLVNRNKSSNGPTHTAGTLLVHINRLKSPKTTLRKDETSWSYGVKEDVTRKKMKQESCAIAKMTAQCALHMGALEIFGTPWLRPRTLFPIFSWAFVPVDPINVPTKFEVRSFTRCWDNTGYPKNLGSPWIRPRSVFWKIFNGLLYG